MNTFLLLLAVVLVGTALSNPDKEIEEILERDLERLLLKRLLQSTDKVDESTIEKKGADDDKDYILVCKQNPIELGIVLDTSSSIYQRDFDKGIKFLQDFLKQFDIGDGKDQVRVALITFAKGIYKDNAFNLDDHHTKADLIEAVGNIKHKKGLYTGTQDGINYMAKNQLSKSQCRDYAERISIVITDGNSQEWRKTIKAAQDARDDGILMFVVGVGRVKESELLAIAGDKERIFKASSYEELKNIKDELARKTCVKHDKPTPPPKTACGEVAPADVYFAFSPIELGRFTGFAKSMVTYTASHEELSEGFRFGVVSGSCPDDEGFDLDDYQDPAGIAERMNAYNEGHMSKLITKLATSGYSKASGGRDSARDIAVLIAGTGKQALTTLKDDVAKLIEKKVEVYVYYPSPKYTLQIDGATTLNGKTSNEVALDLISHMCPESK